ncbi:MAG: Lsr2 family protein [bacterium]|nr:Lsr2 family protein [bacterium]
MAKRTVIIDDLTGDTGARTRVMRFDGVEYEIDLTDQSYAELRALLKPYLRAARAVAGSPSAQTRARKPAASGKSTSDSSAIRAWARGVGMAVTERGVVPSDLRKAWEAAGSPR